jgi:hypothetical protein
MSKARSKRRPVKRTAKSKTKRKPSRRKLSLGRARTEVKGKINALKKLEQTPKVEETIGKLEECLAQFSQICGTHMIIPV